MLKSIKKLLRFIRKKWHADLYISREEMAANLDAILNNQIALASMTARIVLHTPWKDRKFFALERETEERGHTLTFGRSHSRHGKKDIYVHHR